MPIVTKYSVTSFEALIAALEPFVPTESITAGHLVAALHAAGMPDVQLTTDLRELAATAVLGKLTTAVPAPVVAEVQEDVHPVHPRTAAKEPHAGKKGRHEPSSFK